jgi:osmotically-inducible protein OsmY
MNKVPDKEILKKVYDKLGRTGSGGTARVTAAVQSGTVTLSGTLQYEMQRAAMMKAANGVAGVSRVVDQMKVVPKPRPTY